MRNARVILISMKHMYHPHHHKDAGNVVIIILVAVALFAGLTFTLSKSMQGGSTSELDQARLEQYTSNILTYASQADAVVSEMVFNGADISNIDTILPSDVAFETGSDIYKLFHISGGGLNYKTAKEPPFVMVSPAPTTQSGWVTSNVTNVEWTPSAANDLILTAFGIDQNLCAYINQRLTGANTIPALAGEPADELFAEDGTPADLTTTECAACEGYSSLCVSDSGRYHFYSIIGGQ